MLMDDVRNYMDSTIRSPFFLAVGDENYIVAKNKITELVGNNIVCVSSYCSTNDKPPNLDGLYNCLKTADVNVKGKKILVVGLGEYLSLKGKAEAERELSSIKDLPLGTAKVVLLLRGVNEQIKNLHFKPGQKKLATCFLEDSETNITVTYAAKSVQLPNAVSFKELLCKFENGECGSFTVCTMINLGESIFPAHPILNSYEKITHLDSSFNIPYESGSDEQWNRLLKKLIKVWKLCK